MIVDESFYKVASYILRRIKEANDLYKKGGKELKEGLNLFSKKYGFIEKVQREAAFFSNKDRKSAQICFDIANKAVYCLSHTADIETQVRWHKEANRAAKLLNDEKGVHDSGNNLVISLIKAKRENEAIILSKNYLRFAIKIQDRKLQAKILNNLGIAYKNLGEYKKSISCYKKKLIIANKIPDEALIASTYGNLGIVNKEIGNYDKAIFYHKLRLDLAKKLKLPAIVSNAYGDLGITYRHKNDLTESIKYLTRQLRIVNRHNMQDGKGRAYSELSNSMHAKGNIKKAIIYAKKALMIMDERKDSIAQEIQLNIKKWKKLQREKKG
jgi:tetratricopeptide (TPR) repeat protein